MTGWLMDYLGLRWTTGPAIMITVKLEYSAVINFAAEVLTSLTVKLDTTWQLVKGSMSILWLVCHITIWLQAPYFAIVEKTRRDVGLLIVSTVKLEYFTANKIAVRSITNLTVELGIIWRQNKYDG